MELNGESREISPPYFPISLKIDVELISLPYRPIEFVMDLASIDFVVIVPRNWPSSATMIAPSSSANVLFCMQPVERCPVKTKSCSGTHGKHLRRPSPALALHDGRGSPER